MSADRYKIRTSGSLLNSTGLDPRLTKVLTGLGMTTVVQLYSAMEAAPAAFVELLKDYEIGFDDLLSLVSAKLSEEDKARLAAVPTRDYGMGQLGPAPDVGPNIIRRTEK